MANAVAVNARYLFVCMYGKEAACYHAVYNYYVFCKCGDYVKLDASIECNISDTNTNR